MFGCLSHGLEFLHTHKVRHKDIKPRNILVHKGPVIFTDFGDCLDYSTDTGGTTTGRPDNLTRRYCAPEVIAWDRRYERSDIFSLGCVFLEICMTLSCGAVPDGGKEPYYMHIENYRQLLQASDNERLLMYSLPVQLTCQMLDHQPDRRPSASVLSQTLKRESVFYFCSSCAQETSVRSTDHIEMKTQKGLSNDDFVRLPFAERASDIASRSRYVNSYDTRVLLANEIVSLDDMMRLDKELMCAARQSRPDIKILVHFQFPVLCRIRQTCTPMQGYNTLFFTLETRQPFELGRCKTHVATPRIP
jgi:serine/threonine protein kinase